MINQAVIPAAGRGLRLDRPGTPKPLVDVGGLPMVVRLIRQLATAGIEKVVLVTGYEAQKIQKSLKKYDFRCDIVFAETPDWSKGLCQSVLTAGPHVDGPILLAMADHIFDEQAISALLRHPRPDGFGVAMVERRLDDVFTLSSAVKVSLKGDKITGLGRKLSRFDGVDTGLFVLPQAIFSDFDNMLSADAEVDLAEGLSPLIAAGKLTAMTAQGRIFEDVDTPAALVHAEMCLREHRRISHVMRQDASPRSRSTGRFSYRIDAPKETEILVGRGFVKHPGGFGLIPDESASSPIFLFTDDNVLELYGRDLRDNLKAMGYDIRLIVLPEGEESKSLTNYAYLVERVLSQGVDERSVFISLGGGVVCNVCGFVASTIYRGLDLVHLPTTLMAQCDAAVSHKQGINGYQGKNLVGSYYSPRLIALDVETLRTLPDRLIADGMSEIIKHAIGQDADYVNLLLAHDGDIRHLDFLTSVIQRNVQLKCELVATDPKELREGMILQYGHTVGHAVEHLTGYSYYHGESVGVGMAAAARVARIMGACDDGLVALHDKLIEKYNLPTKMPATIRPEDVLASLKYSKRFLTEGTRMALLSGVGRLWRVDGEYAIPVSEPVLTEAIMQCREEG